MREGTTQRARSRALRRAPRPYVGRRSPWWRRAWSRLRLQAAPERLPVLLLDDEPAPARARSEVPEVLPEGLGATRLARPRALQHAQHAG